VNESECLKDLGGSSLVAGPTLSTTARCTHWAQNTANQVQSMPGGGGGGVRSCLEPMAQRNKGVKPEDAGSPWSPSKQCYALLPRKHPPTAPWRVCVL